MRNGGIGSLGTVAVIIGVFIILAIVLPSQFWWFLLGVFLICYGVRLIRCKR